ncbi:MAG: nucleoside-diphosphate kinase [Planctomycetes bacterium]|nr:nucleoside-diphosphate kinase [Planctomycetota bacterium]
MAAKERTLIIIKPDGIQRHLAGEIISRFEKKGLKLAAAKFMKIPEELARKHYAVHEGKPFFEGVVKYLASSPVLVTVWQGDGVIDITRKMMGATFGFDAEPGTIRGDFSASRGYNLIHGSDSPESADTEIKLYFKPDEIVDYEFTDEKWLYGKND